MNLHAIVAEGAVDRFCGRPFSENPYPGGSARWVAWNDGYVHADLFLALRRQRLREAA